MNAFEIRRVPRGAAFRPLALIGAAVGATTTFADPDLWGHVRFGLDMIADGRVRHTVEPYAFTDDQPWVNHEWMSELAMGLAYRTGGPVGLMVLKAVLVVVMLRLVWGGLPSSSSSRWGWMALSAWGTLPLVWSLRPQIWSGIALVIVCRLLTARRDKAIWFLPVIFAIWVNLHGGWIVGGALLAAWTLAVWIQSGQARWILSTAGALCLAATLLNPYGPGMWMFLLKTVQVGREHIVEWQPIWGVGVLPILLWFVPILAIVKSLRGRERPSLPALFALVLLAVLAARVARLGPLFVLATTVLLGSRRGESKAAAPQRQTARVVIDAFAVAAAVLVGTSIGAIPHCISTSYRNSPDTAAGESLRGRAGRLVTVFGWGEYALWHFGPALQVSIDGRRETIYSDAVVREQIAIASGSATGLRALERLVPEYVWLPSSADATANWLKSHGYVEDVRTPRSFVARRSDVPPLRAWDGQPAACFPGP
jgi:hypothetical protein